MWSDERWKVARCCGAKHIWKAKWQNTTFSDHFWKLWCRKSARRCGAKHISKSKVLKTDGFRALLEVEMLKKCTQLSREAHFQAKMYIFGSWEKCTPLWREAHFEVKSAKKWGVRSTFGRSDVVLRGRRRGLCTLSKVSKTWGFCSSFKNDGRRRTFEEDLERCISHGRRSTRDTWGRCVRRSGRRFPESGCILEHQIVSFGKMILCDRCSTSYDLASLFRGRRQAQYFRQVERTNRKTHWYEAVSFALNVPFLKEVSQNCFVFDLANLENWGSIAVSQNCLVFDVVNQLQKLRKSHRIAAFLTLSSSKIGEVSQNSFVFKLADRQIDGSKATATTTTTTTATLQLQLHNYNYNCNKNHRYYFYYHYYHYPYYHFYDYYD